MKCLVFSAYRGIIVLWIFYIFVYISCRTQDLPWKCWSPLFKYSTITHLASICTWVTVVVVARGFNDHHVWCSICYTRHNILRLYSVMHAICWILSLAILGDDLALTKSQLKGLGSAQGMKSISYIGKIIVTTYDGNSCNWNYRH